MSSHRYYCASCGSIPEGDVQPATDGKATGCVLGLTAGAATKNIWAALGMAVIGALIGHVIDEAVTPKCPICGAVLRVLADHFLQ